MLALNCVNDLLRNMYDYEITTMIPLTYTSTCIQYSSLEVLVNGSLHGSYSESIKHCIPCKDVERAFETVYAQIGLLL